MVDSELSKVQQPIKRAKKGPSIRSASKSYLYPPTAQLQSQSTRKGYSVPRSIQKF